MKCFDPRERVDFESFQSFAQNSNHTEVEFHLQHPGRK
jgi:hypothetical protein